MSEVLLIAGAAMAVAGPVIRAFWAVIVGVVVRFLDWILRGPDEPDGFA